jgi:Flp pilus assembly pilin Flp
MWRPSPAESVAGEFVVRFENALRRVATIARDGAIGGQGVVEYGLILSLSALLAAVILLVFGGTLSAVLQAVGDAIDAAT